MENNGKYESYVVSLYSGQKHVLNHCIKPIKK